METAVSRNWQNAFERMARWTELTRQSGNIGRSFSTVVIVNATWTPHPQFRLMLAKWVVLSNRMYTIAGCAVTSVVTIISRRS